MGTGGLVDLDLGQVIRITMVIRSISFIGFVSMPVFDAAIGYKAPHTSFQIRATPISLGCGSGVVLFRCYYWLSSNRDPTLCPAAFVSRI